MSEDSPQSLIALVAHDIHEHGGMERACWELLRRGYERHRFVVIAAGLAPELRPLVQWRRIVVPRRPFPVKFALFFVFAGISLARARADLIHTVGAIVPNRIHLASVHFCHAGFREISRSLALEGTPLLRRLNTGIARALSLAAERWCYRPERTRVLAAVSRGVLRELEDHYPGVPAILTPNGVDSTRFRPNGDLRRGMRVRESIPSEDIIVLFVGGDWDRKGLGVAIRALAKARRLTTPSIRLWVVGRGNQDRFSQLARRCDVGDLVRFFGPRNETAPFYQTADIFVAPSLYEVFPLAALEAAAAGLPLVATRVSGIDELVGQDEAGLLVERDPQEIAEALSTLASHPSLRERMGHAARERSAAYTWERSAQSVLDEYRRLLTLQASEEGTRL